MPTILVVDDEPTIRVLIRAALEGTGYRLLEAADGASALQVARSQRPDLILLDIALPRLSGLEVCRRLKEDPTTAATPILLLTGLVQQAERQAAEEVGAQGFIAKPFSPAALVAQIDDTLLRRAPVTFR
jgi:CheY-like chemotaxis protein